MLINEWTGQGVFILDAKGDGRIETFTTGQGEVLSARDVESRVYREGYGDISYRELEALTDGMFTAEGFAAAREINLAWTNLDWDGIWAQLAQRDDLSGPEVGEVFNNALVAQLSDAAIRQWYSQDGPRTLKASRFEGVEANLPHDDSAQPGPEMSQALAEHVALLYSAALDRMPDISGLNYWIDKAAEGLSTVEISRYFIASDEFQEKYDVSSHEEFLDQLYLNVLDRTADAEGGAYWLDKMEQGMHQEEVLNYFAVSDENVNNSGWLAGLTETDNGWVL